MSLFSKYIKNYNPNNPYEVEMHEFAIEREKERYDELVAKGYTPQWDRETGESTHPAKDIGFYGDCDHPNTPENSTVTIFWIVGMIISLLFKGGWALCILETIAWWKFITRHKNKKQK